jgi:hypothetical protein
MSSLGQDSPGKARTCPHCKATILESASICPACRHYLRFDARAAQRAQASFSALRVEGTIHPPATGETWEYSVLLAIQDARGEEVARQVVGVGALQPAEQRTFVLSVEVFSPTAAKAEEAVIS